jgi:hypothetical protein
VDAEVAVATAAASAGAGPAENPTPAAATPAATTTAAAAPTAATTATPAAAANPAAAAAAAAAPAAADSLSAWVLSHLPTLTTLTDLHVDPENASTELATFSMPRDLIQQGISDELLYRAKVSKVGGLCSS